MPARVTPFDWSSVAVLEAQALQDARRHADWTRVFRSALEAIPAALADLAPGLAVTFSPAAPLRQTTIAALRERPARQGWTAVVSLPDGQVWICLDTAVLLSVVDTVVGRAPRRPRSRPMAEVEEAVVASLLASARATAGVQIRTGAAIRRWGSPDQAAWVTSASARHRGATGQLLLVATGLPPARSPVLRPAPMPLPVRAVVARLRAPAALVRDIRPGQLLVSAALPRCGNPTSGVVCQLCLGASPFAEGRALADRLTISTLRPRPKGLPMDTPTTDKPTTNPALAAARIELEIVVGRSSQRLDRLSELAVGDVVRLDRSVGDPVDIVVSGTTVALGELVDIDGSLGVRVVRLASTLATNPVDADSDEDFPTGR